MTQCRGLLFQPYTPARRQMAPISDSVLTESLERAAGRKGGPSWGLGGKHHMHAVPDSTWVGFHQQGLARSTSSRRLRLLTAWLVTCWSLHSTSSSSGTCTLLITITTAGWVPLDGCCWQASLLRLLVEFQNLLCLIGNANIFRGSCHNPSSLSLHQLFVWYIPICVKIRENMLLRID